MAVAVLLLTALNSYLV